MPLAARLLTLRKSPVLLKLPPYLSALCIVIGIGWLLLLPLDEYSRQTYISENAILPGQVHTYFGGSEHNIFRAYRQEVWHLGEKSDAERIEGLQKVLSEHGLKTTTQQYEYRIAGESINGTNVYGLLKGPRADATEAMVLMAAWRNLDDVINYSGVALALTMARYFSRWSIWSKDIIVLIPGDSYYGSQAWVEAYHTTNMDVTSSKNVSALSIKAGALQGAVALDYSAGPWGHRFEKLDILYDGINGALPNLDLLNTAVSVASSQMGIGCSLHGISKHKDSYTDRLRTLAAGVVAQGAGHATGPHSAFMPYHVDAITLKTIGDGWHDEMTLGRTTESLFRSINNILEHLHQSFFFYILLNAHRFVSIGNYLPAAMLVAGSFTITALALWVQSGRKPVAVANGPPMSNEKASTKLAGSNMEMVQAAGSVALVPKVALESAERHLAIPAAGLLAIQLLGCVPLYTLTHLHHSSLSFAYYTLTASTILLPLQAAYILARPLRASEQQIQIVHSFSLLLLGAALATLATVNFSMSLVVGLAASPLPFLRPMKLLPTSSAATTAERAIAAATLPLSAAAHLVSCPPVLLLAVSYYWQKDLTGLLVEMARGWSAQGVWSCFVFWCLLWPSWVVGGVVLWSGFLVGNNA